MRMIPCGPWEISSKSRMKPSSLRICATLRLIFEAGISTVSRFAVFALRIRVSISAIGSVTTPILPARFRHARDEAAMRVLAKTDAAHPEFTQVTARTTADLAAVVVTHLILLRMLRLLDQRCSRHLASPRRLLQWESHSGQEFRRLLVGLRGRHDRDVHAAHFVDPVVVDFGKDDLLAQPQVVVAASVEALAR